jgi:hypothetical protein
VEALSGHLTHNTHSLLHPPQLAQLQCLGVLVGQLEAVGVGMGPCIAWVAWFSDSC